MLRDIAAERAEIDRVIAGRTLCLAFAETVERFGDREALRWRDPDGTWNAHTWSGYRDHVRDASLGLRALGFEPGSFGVIMARNRPEHVIADQAVVHARGTPVSLYNTLAPEQVAYIAGHCDATVAFVENPAFLEKFLKVRQELPKLERVVMLEGAADVGSDWVVGWDEVLERGREEHAAHPNTFDEAWRAVKPTDMLTLIYTSGTTGPPKGVMDTHKMVLWHWECFRRTLEVRPDDQMVSYLPLAHAAERCATHWHAILSGMTVSYCPDLTQLLVALTEVRPTFFVAVPRVWEKLYAGINAALAGLEDEKMKTAVMGAIDLGRQVVAHEQKATDVPAELRARFEAAQPALIAVRARVGLDRVRGSVVGAAPVATEVIEFFHALGVRISEVWGMSELTALATSNGTERIKIGSVGIAAPGCEVRIAGDGELLVRSGGRMEGYYKDPEKTAEAIDADGWMHTGDVGTVDEDGYFSIIDRKKELIITAGGKNLSPANLENALKHHPLIGQACAIGDRRPFVSALVVLDPEVAPAWARQRGIEASSVAELSQHPEVAAEVQRAVDGVNDHVSRVESIRRFAILPTEWTAESEELTPTMKLKRRVIDQKYADVIEGMYQA